MKQTKKNSNLAVQKKKDQFAFFTHFKTKIQAFFTRSKKILTQDISLKKSTAVQAKKSATKLTFLSRIGTASEREYFVENLGLLLSSGMDIQAALRAIQAEMKIPAMRQLIDSISADVEAGSYIWQALDRAELLSPHIIALIRIGEESGRLAENLKVVVLQQQKSREFRSKLRSAMMYPLFVLSLAMFIGVGIAWFILPRLASVFSQLKLALPLITKVLIGTGKFLGTYGIIVIPLFFAVLAIGSYFLFFFPKTKHYGQSLLFSLPVIKTLIQELELSRFGYILGTLLQAGLPITDALGSLLHSSTLETHKPLYQFLRENIESGNSFATSFALYAKIHKFLPTPIQQMIVSGENSGNLPETFLNIGRIFEGKTENTTKNLTVLLEPLLLVVIWSGVVSVALAVILPVYSLIGGINRNPTPTTLPQSALHATAPEKESDSARFILTVEGEPFLVFGQTLGALSFPEFQWTLTEDSQKPENPEEVVTEEENDAPLLPSPALFLSAL